MLERVRESKPTILEITGTALSLSLHSLALASALSFSHWELAQHPTAWNTGKKEKPRALGRDNSFHIKQVDPPPYDIEFPQLGNGAKSYLIE